MYIPFVYFSSIEVVEDIFIFVFFFNENVTPPEVYGYSAIYI